MKYLFLAVLCVVLIISGAVYAQDELDEITVEEFLSNDIEQSLNDSEGTKCFYKCDCDYWDTLIKKFGWHNGSLENKYAVGWWNYDCNSIPPAEIQVYVTVKQYAFVCLEDTYFWLEVNKPGRWCTFLTDMMIFSNGNVGFSAVPFYVELKNTSGTILDKMTFELEFYQDGDGTKKPISWVTACCHDIDVWGCVTVLDKVSDHQLQGQYKGTGKIIITELDNKC